MPATIEQWNNALKGQKKRCLQFEGTHELIPLYNLALRTAHNLNIIDDDYVYYYMIDTYGEERFFDMLIYLAGRPTVKIPKPVQTLSTPKKDELTLTKNYYGMLTFSTLTSNKYVGADKQTEEEAIEYLLKIYNAHFNPKIKTYKGISVNCWIEKKVSSGFVHMHVFYQRDKGWLFVGSGFLKHGIDKKTKKPYPIKHDINNTCFKSDTHIIHAYNYEYNDSDSVVLRTFEKQIKSLS